MKSLATISLVADRLVADRPEEGVTQFVAVTETGSRAARAAEEELGGGGHPLSALFYAGHDVITEIRRLDEG